MQPGPRSNQGQGILPEEEGMPGAPAGADMLVEIVLPAVVAGGRGVVNFSIYDVIMGCQFASKQLGSMRTKRPEPPARLSTVDSGCGRAHGGTRNLPASVIVNQRLKVSSLSCMHMPHAGHTQGTTADCARLLPPHHDAVACPSTG